MKRLLSGLGRLRAARPFIFALGALSFAAFAAFALGHDGSSAATQYTDNVGGGSAGISSETFRPKVIFVNQGDSVRFVNPYEEIHTVTFVPDGKVPDLIIPSGPPPKNGPPTLIFNPKIASATPPQGPAQFDGTAFISSAIMGKGDSYTVTFSKTGTFKFVCVVHPGMEANVSVLNAGVTVPNQTLRDNEAATLLARDIAAGERAAAAVNPTKTTNANGTTTWQVVNAPSAGQVDINRFIPARLSVGVGDSVTWDNRTLVPHTVTFLSGAPEPELVLPQFGASGPPTLVANPQVLFQNKPSQAFDGTAFVNSGLLGTGPEATAGTSFSLTFTRAGTYSYICMLHDDQGMAGVVQVGPGGGGGASIQAPNTGDGGLPSRVGFALGANTWAGLAIAGLVAAGIFVHLVKRPA